MLVFCISLLKDLKCCSQRGVSMRSDLRLDVLNASTVKCFINV